MILLEASPTAPVGDRLYEAIALLVIALVVAVTQRITNKNLNQKLKNTTNTVDEVKNTLTENNGGSTVKDKLDRIIANQDRHDLQFRYLESQQDNIQSKQDRLEYKQDRQDEKMDDMDKKLNDHIHNGLGRNRRKQK